MEKKRLPRVHVIDRFGFLPSAESWTVAQYQIKPVTGFARTVRQVLADADAEGRFHYPPQFEGRTSAGSGARRRKHVRQQAHLFSLPSTHLVTSMSTAQDSATFRAHEGAFIIHVLGFLHKSRSQFDGWKFDGRVPVRTSPICLMTAAQMSTVVTHLLTAWRGWPIEVRKRYLAILFHKARLLSYRWSWERFSMEYMVFDALFRCADDLKLLNTAGGTSSRRRHRDRFQIVGGAGLIGWNNRLAAEADLFVYIRNELTHEGTLFSETPTTDITPHAFSYLSMLNDRLALAIAGVPCSFVRSNWATFTPSVIGLQT